MNIAAELQLLRPTGYDNAAPICSQTLSPS